jgi:DNA-binding MarR family transcriptional regulator
MSWRPQVDILEPVAKESLRAKAQTGCHPIESDLDAQHVGQLAKRFDHVLYLLWARYGRAHATDIASINLTQAQLSTLTTLIDKGPTRMCDLAASRRVRAPTTRGIIRRLLELDLVTRRCDSSDQRIVHVDITARGRSAQRKAVAVRKQQMAAELTQLNKRDRQALRRALPLLELIAQAAYGGQLGGILATRSQKARGRQVGRLRHEGVRAGLR